MIRKTYIKKEELLHIFRKILSDKNRSWICSDFAALSRSRSKSRMYLETLVSLGVLEKVRVFYTTGAGLKADREIIGYKLIK